ncbi:MAG: chemotaxis protein CheX [Proteobacteria bacterium]|nr:chemotaxis protein CheX [Pseudomonadota bacterium]
MDTNQEKKTSGSQPNLLETLFDAVSDTIENMAFIEVVKVDKTTPYDEHLVRLRVEILINSPFPGEMRLVLPISLAVLFAQNMYNLEEKEITESLMKDVLGEIVNIMSGRLMAEIIPPDQTFQLGLPQIGPDVFLETEASSLSIEFDAEGTPFWIILFGDGFLQSE